MSRAFLGIDPGISRTTPGAMALIFANIVELQDWVDAPTMNEKLEEWMLIYDIMLAAIEQITPRPIPPGPHNPFCPKCKKPKLQRRITDVGAIMENYGLYQGLLIGGGVPFITVRPQEWQKGLVPKKMKSSDKPSLTVARQLFPQADLKLQKHHGRADALLIADWLRRSGR